jgi:hypothetical protein
MRTLDRLFGGLLMIGATLHAYGSLASYPPQSVTLVWSLAASLAGFLLAAINLMRVNRSSDRTLACVSLAGSLCWLAVVIAFGTAIQSVTDPRVLYHAIVPLVLAALSLRTAVRAS